jgi:hypothetical protein
MKKLEVSLADAISVPVARTVKLAQMRKTSSTTREECKKKI